MGATYTRQSSSAIVDGGVIEASDINAEFNQVLAAFAVTSGHTHDGTAAEGGPITKLLGTAITIGDATAGTDIAVTFDGESNDGVVTWMEDEDYFQFSDDLLLTTTEKLQFRDTAIYINSSADGQLDLVADTEIQIAATTVDINGAVALNGAITGATNITLSGELDAATLDISGDADIDGTLEADAITINGTAIGSIYGAVAGSSSIITTGALNSGSITSGFGSIDNGSSAITTTGLISGGSLDIDNVLINGTTIGHTDDTDLLTVASGLLTVAGEVSMTTLDIGGTNVTSTAAELNLVDGITAGTVSASLAVIADSNKDISGFRNVTLTGELDAATGDFSGDVDVDGTLEADAITVNGTALASVIAGTTVNNATTAAVATTVTVTDNESTNENNAIIFTAGGDLDGGNLGLESDGDLKYNPSTGTLSATNISVSGTFSTVNSVTMDANNAVIFEGSTADAHETTLTSIDATGDRTISLPNVSGTLPVLAAVSTTQISSTPEELNILDGVTATATELNIIDGNATVGTTAVADGDGIVTNDGGTMRQTTVQTFATYFGSEITTMSNLVTTGALDSGSITSGFGAIDNGTSNIRSATITAETAFVPDASGGADLGTTALEFNDAFFNDGAVINFGDDQDTTLTHTDGTGLTLNSTNKLCFNDASQFIQGSSATVLSIGATDEIDLTATAVDLNGTLNVSGTLTQTGVATFAVAANVAQVALSSSSNAIAWDASAAANAYHVTTENTTFSAPSNAVEGAFIAVEINYNGSHTIAFNTVFEFAGSTAPTTTDTDGKTDILVFRYNGAVWQEVGRTLNLSES